MAGEGNNGFVKDNHPAEKVGEPFRKKGSLWLAIRESMIILVMAAVVAVGVQSFFLKAFIIPSLSMSPTLQVGDRVMVDRATYCFRKPRRGDVVVWRYPPSGQNSMNTSNPLYWPFEEIGETLHLTHEGVTPYVKRVVATEGETIQLKDGQLYINQKRVNEPYAVKNNCNFGPVKTPKGMFYGFGDNRPNSRDSRSFGPIPYRNVIGRVFLRWWPPNRFGKPQGQDGSAPG
ncbi:MAG: signal peptidase I [Candidatus Anoxymicrobium japonicum]|uniref:Signal peptidase I n=1 Tax=Candidatus Anoxymicrobium japonicum TaxID=2013648 RepID=A0A2N3G800_9ACTN|nr:MAG: signal peptidase I [Candidatus Anoxymicrobium japonicum]